MPAHGEYPAAVPAPFQRAADLVVAPTKTAYTHKIVTADSRKLPAGSVIHNIFKFIFKKILLSGNVFFSAAFL